MKIEKFDNHQIDIIDIYSIITVFKINEIITHFQSYMYFKYTANLNVCQI